MKINFITPSLGNSGGMRVIFEYANRLKERGHEVTIIYPLIPYLGYYNFLNIRHILSLIKYIFFNLFKRQCSWFSISCNIKKIFFMSKYFIPNADFSIATAWPTAYTVNNLPPSKGKKLYLVQHYENLFGPKPKVDKTYKFSLKKIVVSSWLKKCLKKELKVSADKVILNGINLEHFYPVKTKKTKDFTVLLFDNHQPFKGTSLGVKVFETLRKQYSSLKLVMFGLKKTKYVPSYATYYENPPQSQLKHIYSSADVLLYTSLYEGFGLPPLEAMACGCAVIATNVGAVPEIIEHGRTGIIIKKNTSDCLKKALELIIKNPPLRKKISQAASKNVSRFQWPHAVDTFENYLIQLKNGQ